MSPKQTMLTLALPDGIHLLESFNLTYSFSCIVPFATLLCQMSKRFEAIIK